MLKSDEAIVGDIGAPVPQHFIHIAQAHRGQFERALKPTAARSGSSICASMSRRRIPLPLVSPPMTGVSLIEVATTVVLLSIGATSPSLTSIVKVVITVPPGATWFSVGSKTSRRMAACAAADVPEATELIVPFFKDIAIELGWMYVLLTYFVIVGSSNAVNLTDGLDGLAILPTVMVGGALGIFAYLSGHSGFSGRD